MAVDEKHEDEELQFCFEDEILEMMENYDEDLEASEVFEPSDDADGLEQLMYEYCVHEPQLSYEELQHLDAIADGIEVKRLRGMNVLKDMEANDAGAGDMKSLSARFVRTWRDKIVGDKDSGQRRVWLRRSRLVAREYSWLADRSDLFSPASNSISGRLLQTMFLRQRDEGFVLAAIDVADAFLTVGQRERTKVSLVNAVGTTTVFQLGKVLPGQRAGSQWWYEDLTGVLCAELQMKQCEKYPNLLCNDDRSCLVLLHVDDRLICGKKEYVHGKLIPTLENHYKISSSFLQEVGDELTFLKRSHKLLMNGRLAISRHPRHIEQLMKLTGVTATSKPKRSWTSIHR